MRYAGIMVLLAVAFGTARVVAETMDRQRQRSFDLARFQVPLAEDRPRFRYWVPSGNIDPNVVTYDIQQIADKGFGGAEYLDLVGYASNDTISDPKTYAWQSTASRNAMSVFYETAASLGMNADFAQGPNQGAGVPFENADDQGTSVELVRGTVFVPRGTTFNGPIPRPLVGPSEGVCKETLIAVVSVRMESVIENATVFTGVLGADTPILDLSSARAHEVMGDTVTVNATDGDVLIFTFYERSVGEIAAYGGFAGSDASNNNTWTTYHVDHWSITGAQAIIDSLTLNFLPTLGEYWNASVGKYLWEDSLEIPTHGIPWTPGLLSRIRKDRGIDLTTYLPFLYANVSTNTIGPHYSPWAGPLYKASSDEDNALLERIRADYYAQLTTGYTEYVGALAEFAHSVGLEYSCQPGYGMPLDIQAAWPLVDTPEIESLFFADNITAYRYATGAQHLSKKNILSTEIGAVALGAYQVKWPAYLASAHTSFAGGINQFVWHGYAYSGTYGSFPKTPGWEAWFYLFSEAHGPRQPSWEYVKPNIESLARTQYILSLGQPCVDLAIYRLTYGDDNFDPSYKLSHAPIDALVGKGYTYEYVSPALFDLDTSVVIDGHLSPTGGPGYSALVFDNQTEVTVAGITKALSYAQSGLPVVFVERLPFTSPYYSEVAFNVSAIVEEMLHLPAVKLIASLAELPAFLETINVEPNAKFAEHNSNIFSVKRWEPTSGDDYFYLYNDGPNTTTLTVQIANAKKQMPWSLDTWSGSMLPIAAYEQSQGRLHMNVTLAPSEYRLLTLSNSTSVGTSAQSAVGDVDLVVKDGQLIANLFDNATHSITLGNGTCIVVGANVASPEVLGGWSMDVRSWVALPDDSSTTGYTTESISINKTDLTTFGHHPTLANVSGTAVYTTTFEMGASPHAYLDLGLCSHTCNISVNGKPGPPLNILHPVTDVSDLLVPGINTLEIEVSTPLGNFLRMLAIEGYNSVLTNGTSTVYNAGFGEFFPGFLAFSSWDATYGLVSPVRVLPYKPVVVVG